MVVVVVVVVVVLVVAPPLTVAKYTGYRRRKHLGQLQKTPPNRRKKHRFQTDAKNTEPSHRSKKHWLPTQKTRNPKSLGS